MEKPSRIISQHLIPPLVGEMNAEPKVTLQLAALVARVTELRGLGLTITNCADEFMLRHIRPLGQRSPLAYPCLRLNDPHRVP
jgi:hypothetical protein